MRNPTLHRLLEAFTADSAMSLEAAAHGDEIPFELVQDGKGRVPLYCYRPLTGAFIRSHLGLLVALPSYAPAAQALESGPGLDGYLRARGEARPPQARRDSADAALRCFLARVFEERSAFGFDPDRFERAYEELERCLYAGRCVTEVVGELQGLELDPDTLQLALGDDLSIMRVEALVAPPAELAQPAAQDGPPCLVLVLRSTTDTSAPAPIALARTRFGRALTALRLFDRGALAVARVGFSRVDEGAWTPVALGRGGRSGAPARVVAEQEDELRAFCNLIARRLPDSTPDRSGAGELAWALSRFEMGYERDSPLETLTDHLLALRALLEPEGPSSGRLAQRLAVICARPLDRIAFAERAAAAVSLERAVVSGLARGGEGDESAESLVAELSDHLRAILRDVLCGYLDVDVRTIADELLAEAAGAPV